MVCGVGLVLGVPGQGGVTALLYVGLVFSTREEYARGNYPAQG